MKTLPTVALALLLLVPGEGRGGELPAIYEKPFLGCFVGFRESRDFDFAIGADGTSELFFKEGDERLSLHGSSIKFRYILEEQQKGKTKWTNRTMQEDGFETTQKETASPEPGKPVTFTATFTGDTKVEITHVFSRDSVLIRTRILEKKTEGKVRVGVRVSVGDLYRHIKEKLPERELKSKIKDSELRVWPVEGRSSSGEKIELYEDLKLQEEFPKGATKFSLESDRIGDKEIIFSTGNEDLGWFQFRQTRELYHGFSTYWYPDPEKSAEQDCHLVVEVK